MDAYSAAFELTGKMSSSYYQNRIVQIKHEIDLMDDQTEGLNTQYLMMLKMRLLQREKEAPVVEKHEAVFEKTGRVTPYLKETQLRYTKEQYEEDMALHAGLYEKRKSTELQYWREREHSDGRYNDYATERGRKYAADILEIDRLSYQKDLKTEKNIFKKLANYHQNTTYLELKKHGRISGIKQLNYTLIWQI